MTGVTREQFLKLSWEEQKATDFRKVFDPETEVNLTARCINPRHRDSNPSMTIYEGSVACFGCIDPETGKRTRWWPDDFLKELGDRALVTERGTRKRPAPKFIPLAVPDTYRRWLWSVVEGHYQERQQWLLDRGLSRETCIDNHIGHTGEAFSIPIFDGRTVRSIRYRRDDLLSSEDRPKYWGTAGANESMLYQPNTGSKTLNFKYGTLLAEGELDALRLVEAGYPAVSLTNGCNAIKPEHVGLLHLGFDRRVTVCYDQDEPGRAAAAKALTVLWKAGVQAHAVQWSPSNGKDVTEFACKSSPNSLRYFDYLLEETWRSGS